MASHSLGAFSHPSLLIPTTAPTKYSVEVLLLFHWQVWKWGPQSRTCPGSPRLRSRLSLRSSVPPSQRQHSLESVPAVTFLGWHRASCFASSVCFLLGRVNGVYLKGEWVRLNEIMHMQLLYFWLPWRSVVKNPPCSAGDVVQSWSVNQDPHPVEQLSPCPATLLACAQSPCTFQESNTTVKGARLILQQKSHML